MPVTNPTVTSYEPGQDKAWYQRLWEGLRNLAVGHPEIIHMLNQLNPEQQETASYLGQSGRSLLENPYQGFENIQNSALNTFQTDIVPALLERFSASGSNSSSSPVLQAQLSSAGASLAERLKAFQEQFAQQNRAQGLQQVQLSLNPQSQFLHSPATTGLAGGFAAAGGQAAGKYLGKKFLT